MITAGVAEVKSDLGHYLTCIKEGEDVLIIEQGKPIARIVPEREDFQSVRIALAPLIQKGLVTMAEVRPMSNRLQPVSTAGKPVSELVLEDRR